MILYTHPDAVTGNAWVHVADTADALELEIIREWVTNPPEPSGKSISTVNPTYDPVNPGNRGGPQKQFRMFVGVEGVVSARVLSVNDVVLPLVAVPVSTW